MTFIPISSPIAVSDTCHDITEFMKRGDNSVIGAETSMANFPIELSLPISADFCRFLQHIT